jgi:hypothetical protein
MNERKPTASRWSRWSPGAVERQPSDFRARLRMSLMVSDQFGFGLGISATTASARRARRSMEMTICDWAPPTCGRGRGLRATTADDRPARRLRRRSSIQTAVRGEGSCDHPLRQRWLGSEFHLIGNSRGPASLPIDEPVFRDVQFPIDQSTPECSRWSAEGRLMECRAASLWREY